jgi:hypothetical protein
MTLMELLGMERQHQRTRTDIDALRREARAAQVARPVELSRLMDSHPLRRA